MAEVIILQHDRRVGSLVFDEHPSTLRALRTSGGFSLSLPAEIGLESSPKDQPRLALNNLHVVLSVTTAESRFEVGRISHSRAYSAFVTYRDEDRSESLQQIDLTWRGQLPDLFAVERACKDKKPEIDIEVRADLYFIIICEQWQDHVRSEPKRFEVATQPTSFFGQTKLVYPQEVWRDMVTSLLKQSRDDPFLRLLPFS
jgi:hypothetical protein